MVDFKRLHNTITISLSIGIIVANIIVIYLVHTKECHKKSYYMSFTHLFPHPPPRYDIDLDISI